MIDPYPIAAVVVALLWIFWFTPWHTSIELPTWSPPAALIRWGWIVGLAATVVAWSVANGAGGQLVGLATGLLWAQLVLGLAWAALFYKRRRARTGFTVICLHWSAIGLAAAACFAIDPVSGAFLLPWLAFITYVGAFNFFVWQLEPRP